MHHIQGALYLAVGVPYVLSNNLTWTVVNFHEHHQGIGHEVSSSLRLGQVQASSLKRPLSVSDGAKGFVGHKPRP